MNLVMSLQKDLSRLRQRPTDTLQRIVGWIRGALVLRSCERGARVCAHGKVRVVNHGRIVIGDGVTFLAGPVPTELVCGRGATLRIGAHTTLNYGVSVEADQSVSVGASCEFGSYVRICDRARSGASPISIGDRVWLAHGVVVEPGTTLGDGAVVAAASVVTEDVGAGSLASGNPARSIPLSLAGKR